MNKPNNREAFILMDLLDSAFYEISLQESRIKEDKKNSNLKSLFSDIHFLLISFCNLKKILKKLHSCLRGDTELKTIFDRYESDLAHLNTFRDHLEHITEGRLGGNVGRGKKLINPSMLGNLTEGGNYDFGGEQFNLNSSFELSRKLRVKLENWNKTSKIYPLWYLPTDTQTQ